MRIRSIHIENLGSIENMTLDDLDKFTVIVGRNGSGKTFLFDGLRLFFGEFQTVGGDSVAKNDSYLWHGQDTDKSISISVSLEATSNAERRLCGQIQTASGKPLEIKKEVMPTLTIERQLAFGEGWTTPGLQVDGEIIVANNRLASGPAPVPELTDVDLSSWKLHLFDEGYDVDNIGGSRLLTDAKTHVAYHSDPSFDSLASKELIELNVDTVGKNLEQWAENQHFSIVARVPTREEAPDLFTVIDAMKKTQIAALPQRLVDAIRGCFMLLPVARDSREPVAPRAPVLDADIRDSLKNLSISTKRTDVTKFHRLKTDVEDLVDKDLEPNPQQVFAEVGELRLPLSHLGGGEQSVIGLLWRLEGDMSIVAIEEPENHLHPTLVKGVFKYLRKRASDKQIILSTHSPLMVDKSNLANNWLFQLVDGRTEPKRVQDENDLRTILAELGVTPSDIYLRDLVVFVEGGTEKEAVFPIWADKVGVPIKGNMSIGLIAIGGDKKLKANLRIWLELVKHAPVDYFVVLDGHAAEIKEQVVKDMDIPPDKIYVLSKHCIEDYYPPRYVVDALKALWDIEIESEEAHLKPDEPRAKTIEGILQRESKIEGGWKVALGQHVASRMTVGDIDNEIKEVMREIGQRLKTASQTA